MSVLLRPSYFKVKNNNGNYVDVNVIASDVDEDISNLKQQKANNSNIAQNYSASSKYAIGDLVLYNNTLYKCKVAITTAEAWTASHWEQVTIGSEISELNDGVSDVNGQVEDLREDLDESVSDLKSALEEIGVSSQSITFTGGYIIDNRGTITRADSSSAWKISNDITVEKGQTIKIQTDTYSNTHIVAVAVREGNDYTPKVYGNGTDTVYEYTATEDCIIVVSVPRNDSNPAFAVVYYEILGKIESTSDAVDTVANNIFATDVIKSESIAALFNVEKLQYNLNPTSSTKCVLAQNESYNSYYFEVTNDQELYFADLSTLTYIALGIVKQVSNIYTDSNQNIHIEGTSASRMRKSEGNMPTSDSPLSIESGDICIVTIPTIVNASNVPVFIYQAGRSNTLLNNNIRLNADQISQALKKGYLQYVSGSGNDASTERINVFISTHIGYIKYELLHSVYANNNCNVWRVGRVSHAADNFLDIKQLTTNGEWECAIKLYGRDDFAGGYNHGDELLTDVTFYVDGASVDVSTLTDIIPFEELKIIQCSNLYDPNDHTTIFAKHGSCHKFSIKCENNLEIDQSIEWLGSYSLMPSYLAMFPPLKTTTDKIFNDLSFKEENIALPQTLPNVKNVTLSKNSIAFSCLFGIANYPEVDNMSGTFFITDNNKQAYNKCYYYVCGNNANVSAGDIWKSKTIYNLQIGN